MFQRISRPTCFWAVAFGAALPGLVRYLFGLSDLEHYGYVWALLISLAALVAFRWDRRLRLPSDRISLSLLLSGVGSLALALYLNSPWTSAVGFACIAYAWLRTHSSATPPGHNLGYLGLLIVLMIRFPLALDTWLTTSLQRFTSTISSSLLDSVGVIHYLRGNVVVIPRETLFVEESCSGIQSLFTLLFLVCLWIVFKRRPLVALPVYAAATIGWAVTMNVVRVSFIAIGASWYGVDLSSGISHEAVGWLCLLFAFALVLSTDRIVHLLFSPVDDDDARLIDNPFVRSWNAGLRWGYGNEDPFASSFANRLNQLLPTALTPLKQRILQSLSFTCLVCFTLSLALPLANGFAMPVSTPHRIISPPSELLDNTTLARFHPTYEQVVDTSGKGVGKHADIWTLTVEENVLHLAICQTYPEWHDMRNCYRGDGWHVNQWTPCTERPGATWPVSHAELIRQSGDYGTLLFAGIASDGTTLSPPTLGLLASLGQRQEGWARRSPTRSDQQVVMIQMWTESRVPPDSRQIARQIEIFQEFRNLVHQHLQRRADAA